MEEHFSIVCSKYKLGDEQVHIYICNVCVTVTLRRWAIMRFYIHQIYALEVKLDIG